MICCPLGMHNISSLYISSLQVYHIYREYTVYSLVTSYFHFYVQSMLIFICYIFSLYLTKIPIMPFLYLEFLFHLTYRHTNCVFLWIKLWANFMSIRKLIMFHYFRVFNLFNTQQTSTIHTWIIHSYICIYPFTLICTYNFFLKQEVQEQRYQQIIKNY